MIQARMTAEKEAVLPLMILGANGIEVVLPSIIDTGFTEMLSLSKEWIDALDLEFVCDESVILADGSSLGVEIYKATVVWDGKRCPVRVHCMEGDPLIGMGLMKDFLLHLPVRIGSEFTISEID